MTTAIVMIIYIIICAVFSIKHIGDEYYKDIGCLYIVLGVVIIGITLSIDIFALGFGR